MPRIVWLVGLLAAAVSQVYMFSNYWSTWPERLQAVAFFAGSGGMILMFHRWRARRDSLAGMLCLIAVATWAAAVVAGSVTTQGVEVGSPAFFTAGAALLIGTVGAMVILVRGRAKAEAEKDEPPPA
ncbi:hypothetical protein [Planotetraspora sp. GP83]|uniref:hypothetical protein n=1 Tax=Planotetraspora sp. GP83 TaxID=3156264 RepID=UPI0035125313